MFTAICMNGVQRFLNVMDYKPVDKVPNYEAGVWTQTVAAWQSQGLDISKVNWDWFSGDDYFGMDKREFFPVNMGMMPMFKYQLLEKTEHYEVFRDEIGRTRRALIEGTVYGGRMCMDEYLRFPVEDMSDWRDMKKRYIVDIPSRYPKGWDKDAERWKNRQIPLIFGRNCSTLGFYWMARDFMGTEGVSYALYDQPELMYDMMEFIADFTIEMSRPFLEVTDAEYVMINEDMSMKTGPLISPSHYKEYIFPHMRRLADFYKSHGVKYVFVDTDGNCEALLPLLLDAGVDGILPAGARGEHGSHTPEERIRQTASPLRGCR
ncbi:MAG: uroporphyrinogen decarboxylase family protein [Eubacteriales bacterium]